MKEMETDEGRVKEISLGGKKRVALDYTEEELSKMTTGKEERKRCIRCGEVFPNFGKRDRKLCRQCFGQVVGVGRRLAFKGKRISKALKKSWKKREKIEVKPLGLSSRIASLERRVKKLEVLLG